MVTSLQNSKQTKIVSTKKILAAVCVFISRLKVFPANFSPVGSFGFFGGRDWRGLTLYFTTIIGFDYFVGGFYRGFWLTHLGFAVYPILGSLAGGDLKKQFSLLPAASVSFFILSNLSSFWLWYPHTIEGLITCYVVALPFYTNTALSDVVFGYGYLAAKFFAKSTVFQKLQHLSADWLARVV